MNASRRKRIAAALESLSSLTDEIENIASDEREAFDNMPEGLQQGDKGQALEEMADALDELAGQVRECAEWSDPS